MPWKESSPMDEKVRFIATLLEGEFSITHLCRATNISRKTGYKWLSRYERFGAEGLVDQSRAPKTSSHEVTKELKSILIEARLKHPNWGARKIVAWLGTKQPHLKLPAASTVGEIFKKNNLIRKKAETRFRAIANTTPVFNAKNPNSVWCVDYKGGFRLGNGQMCYPLTITDYRSRFILCCNAKTTTNTIEARKIFEKVFKLYGIPEVILSDNGMPFSTPTGFSNLNVWWMKLGIQPLRTQLGKPQQNGRHERMHRTLKQETARPPARDLASQQKSFDHFVKEFNYERPHEGLENKTPAAIYRPSSRSMPKRLQEVCYPLHMEKRKVDGSGRITWKGREHFIATALGREQVGIEEIDDGLWIMYFGKHKVGYLNDRTNTFERVLKRYTKVSPMSPV